MMGRSRSGADRRQPISRRTRAALRRFARPVLLRHARRILPPLRAYAAAARALRRDGKSQRLPDAKTAPESFAAIFTERIDISVRRC